MPKRAIPDFPQREQLAGIRAGLGVSVEVHPVLSLVWVASAPSASKEARMNNVLRNYI
jgi:hypothetical protein